MQDFPANSAKSKARSESPPRDDQPEKIGRVISGEASQRPRGLGRRFKDTFIEGSARTAMEYVVVEVVVPAIQDTLIEALQGGFERLIRGDHRPRRPYSSTSSSSYSGVPRVDYQGMSQNRAPASTNRMLSRQARSRHDFGEIILQSRQDGEDVIDRMFDVLSRYGSVTVSVLYEMTGIDSSHVDEKWGWTSLRGARAVRQGENKYLLDLPEPEFLGR